VNLPNFKAILAAGGTLGVELKSDINDGELVEAVVCLANGGGGLLLIGVDDDGGVCGARPRHGNATDPRRVEALVSNSTRPSIGVQATVATVQGKAVIVVEVPATSVPTATAGGRYLRRVIGGDGRPACVPFFVFETSGAGVFQDPSSVVVPGATWSDLDPLELERFRRLVDETGRGDRVLLGLRDEDLCRAIGGLDANGDIRGIRRVALLLFGRESALRRLLPTHEVAWQVVTGHEVLENEFLRWPLLRSFAYVLERFRVRNHAVELVDLFRTEIPDFSEDAVREAVANALVHRDFTRMGAVHVQWTDEGIRVDSPGGFPEGVRIDNLLVTPPKPRNLLLADAFKRAGIVERTGRGVDSMFHGQLRYGRPAPRYGLSNETSVTVVLPGGPADGEFVRLVVQESRAGRPLTVQSLLVLTELRSSRSLTVADVARLIQHDEATARGVIGGLVDAGLVEAKAEKGSRRIHMSAAVYRALGDRAVYVRTAGFEPVQHEQMVLRYVAEHGRITRGEAAELCRVSVSQAAYLLKKLCRRGALAGRGRGRNAHYVPGQ